MKLKAIIFLIFLLLLGCKKVENDIIAHETQNPISDKIIYDFINSALIENEIYKSCPNILETKVFVNLKIDESEFNFIIRNLKENDSTFIKAQLISQEKFYWKEHLIKNKKIIKIETTADT